MTVIVAGVVILAAVFAGAPLFCIIGGITLYLFTFVSHTDISSTIIDICRLSNAPGISAIPMFVFTGYILAESRASHRLVNLSSSFLGWLPGGPAIVCVVACAIFTALTGASAVTIVAIGALLLPALTEEGFDYNFSMGLVTGTGSIGLLFVPALPVIIYGLFAQTDITTLYVAGVIPGIILLAAISLYCAIHAHRKGMKTVPFSAKRIGRAVWDAKWEIPLPIMIVWLVYGGVVTIGEVSTFTVVYVLISECLIYREISFKRLLSLGWESMVMVGAIIAILGAALGFANYLVDQHVPQELMEWTTQHLSSRVGFLLILNGLLLVVGCLMDIFSAIIIVVPLIVPVANTFGVDPFHLGVIFLLNLGIGYLTPPVGMNLFVAAMRFNVPLPRLFKMILPFLVIMLLVLAVVTFLPDLSTWLPQVLGQRGELIDMKTVM
jgi:tripartite ATP-independent transporter DctM subunit